ncbi:hypothetical protein BDQ12DRAFT_737398 [Crucibulum laeve]|uniref:Transmembrane protein n=1 Tax=Crucibulum laeve TaxID=68775 RepID=A0A5C3M3M3_9AGAR|nr:hypothetical protein BDQ12DRAFT_737398 [Crucibulum laeve]
MSQSRLPVTNQPQAVDLSSMDLYRDYHEVNEKGVTHEHGHGSECRQCAITSAGHKNCHNSRLRRFLVPIIVALLTLGVVLAFSCIIDYFNLFELGTEGLMRRAADAATGTNDNGSFVNRKLYLIVIFVGLFVVIILAVMLSAWFCRGAFENPLCCPCYLCACCGGLACLECIGCGLCAEGIDQM